jgi:hypothetical protein
MFTISPWSLLKDSSLKLAKCGICTIALASITLILGGASRTSNGQEYPPYPEIWQRNLEFRDIGHSIADFGLTFFLKLESGDYAVLLTKRVFDPEDQRRFGDLGAEATAFFSGKKSFGKVGAAIFPGSRSVEPPLTDSAPYVEHVKHGRAEVIFRVDRSDDYIGETFGVDAPCEDPAA